MTFTRIAALVLVVLCLAIPASATDEPIASFSLDGRLKGKDIESNVVEATLTQGEKDQLRYIERGKGRGLYLGERTAVSLPAAGFNPREGTLSFWFRPDWTPPCGREAMIVEISAPTAWRLSLRKGYAHVPDHCYLTVEPGGGTAFAPHNLFTGRTWRQYTLRWSAKRGVIDCFVDGDSENVNTGRTGPFKCEKTGPLKAEVLLSGSACGAFADVKVFDRYLETDEVIKAAGLTMVAAYLQMQKPPPGAEGLDRARSVAYVDPATGQKVEVVVPAGEAASAVRAYNPAAMPQLTETPHTKWARPLAGGPVRALLVLPVAFYHGFTTPVRDGVELWQRMDLQCDITSQPDPAVLSKDYDVIVVSHQGYDLTVNRWLGWTDLDAKLRAWILDRVKSGRSGLVLAYPTRLDDDINALMDPKRKTSAAPILRGFPTAAMHQANPIQYDRVYDLDDNFFENDANLAEKVVEVYAGDKSRVVRFNYQVAPGWPQQPTGLTPDPVNNSGVTEAHYDYWMALMARAVLHAAKREPSARIVSANVTGVRWGVTTEGVESPVTLWYRARDIWGREYARGSQKVKPSSEVTIKGVKLAPRTVVDFWLKDGKGSVIDWFSAAVPPAAETKLTGVTLDKTAYRKGDPVGGKVGLAAKDGGEYRIEVFLSDHEMRRLVRKELPVKLAPGEKTEASFTLSVPPSSDSLLMRVEAALYKDGQLVDERSADCPVPRTQFDGFFFMMYGDSRNRPMHMLSRKLFRDQYEMKGMVRGGGDSCYATLARDNLNQVEYITHLGYPGGAQPDYDMTARENWEDFFPKNLRCDANKVVPFRPIFWSLGEEHYAGIIPTSPTANARFRQYLQHKYGTLEKLNQIWGASFASWDAVTIPGKGGPVDVMKMNYEIPQFEVRRFTEQVFADRHAYLAEYFRKIDPGGEVGIHAGWDLWMGRGYDYWLLSRGMEAMSGYDLSQVGLQNQYIRSFFKHYYGAWNHYYIGSHEDVRWHPWHTLASGARGFGWYSIGGEIWGATTADLHPSSDWAAAAPEYTAGARVGELLARAEYEQDQVAVHYSQDSFHAGVGPALSYIHQSFVNLLFDAGVPFRFVSYQEVAEGVLAKRKYPLLILPHSISLSEEEARAIRAYVQDGGTVWADVLPGTYDNYARKLEQGLLADLFANGQETTLPGGRSLKIGKCGKGTVLLGDIGNYFYTRNLGNHLPIQEMLDRAVEAAGVRRVARVLNRADGQLANGIWTAGYRLGSHRYVLVAKDYRLVDREKADVQVELGPKGHVYEMRSGKYFGQAERAEVALETASGRIFAVLPYQVKGLNLKTKQPAARGADWVVAIGINIAGKIGAEDRHVLRARVTRPDGSEETALRRMVVVAGGQGELRLPIAVNDPPGKWTLRCQDLATGTAKEISCNLR